MLGSLYVVMRPERTIDPATQLLALGPPGLAVVTLAFSRDEFGLIEYAAGIVHALAMAVWLGGLILLTRVVLAGPGEEDLVHAVRGFARISTPALWATVATGAILLFRLDRGHLGSHARAGPHREDAVRVDHGVRRCRRPAVHQPARHAQST